MGFRQKRMSKIFYEDGNHKVAPDNVVSFDIEAPEEVTLDIPDDEDLEEYEVFVPEEDDYVPNQPEIVSGEYTRKR